MVGYIILGIFAVIILIIYILLHISIRAYLDFDRSGVRAKVKYCGFTLYSFDSDDSAKSKSADGAAGDSSEADETKSEIDEITFVDLMEEDASSYEQETPEDTSQPETSQPDEMPEDSLEQGDSGQPAAESKQTKKHFWQKSEDKADSGEDEEKKSLSQRWEEIKPFIPVGKKGLKKLLKLIRLRKLELYLKVGGEDPYSAGKNFARANQAVYPALAVLCKVFSVTIKKTEIDCDYYCKALDFSGSVTVMVRPSAVICLALYLIVNYFIITQRQKKQEEKTTDKNKKEGN